jgi:hypothetical protein
MEHAGCLGGRQTETSIGAWPSRCVTGSPSCLIRLETPSPDTDLRWWTERSNLSVFHQKVLAGLTATAGGWLVHRGRGFGPVAVTSRCGTQSSTW